MKDVSISGDDDWLVNPSLGSWTVLKFGGTSLGKYSASIARDVIVPTLTKNKTSSHPQRLAIICSARSTTNKKQGTTSLLLDCIEIAESQLDIKLIDKTIAQIKEDHINAAHNLETSRVDSEDVIQTLQEDIEKECSQLREILSAACILGEVSKRTRDIVIGVGEKLSCRLFAAQMYLLGIKSSYVNLDQIVPNSFTSISSDFFYKTGVAIATKIEKDVEHVPVITGYFGTVPHGLLQQIGRGYSDLCAALTAIGLNAKELQIWKEVDGIFTADPRIVSNARLLSTISPDEAAELTYYGSEVIHPFTMEQAIRHKIPIRIKNVLNPYGTGTVILPKLQKWGSEDYTTEIRPFVTASARNSPYLSPRTASTDSILEAISTFTKSATAVTFKDRITVLNVQSNRKFKSHDFLYNIFKVLADFRVVADLISTSEVNVSIAISSESDIDPGSLLKCLGEYGYVSYKSGLAILSLVGTKMRHSVGIAGKMFTTLGAAGINLEMISQGASEINISCVIEEVDATRALQVIHHELLSQN